MKKPQLPPGFKIRVRVTIAVFHTGVERIIAQAGQKGYISEWDKEKIGTNRQIMVRLDGFKVNREIPATRLEIIEEDDFQK